MSHDWPTLFEQLTERFGSPETPEIELKSAQGGFPSSLWETVSAFSNTHGGWILLGVREEENGQVIFEGLKKPSARMTEFFTTIRNRNKINHPVCEDGDVTLAEMGADNKPVLIVRVPAAPRTMRPIYINGNPLTGTFVRRHDADFRCTEQEVRRMFREAGERSTDAAVLPSFSIEDLDPESVQGYRQRFQSRDPASPWNRYRSRQFLEAIQAIGKDRETGAEGPTVAGLLMFGKDNAIREWRGRHLIDYQLLPTEKTVQRRWDDRVTWEGNLIGAFDAVYPRLVAGLSSPFQLKGSVRVEGGPEQTVVREALVNLLIHADYTETQTSLIQRSSDGYLFRNPGSSRVPIHDLLHRDLSDPRNPLLVRMFRFAGLAEEAGQGIATIRSLWRELGYQLPTIDVGSERYEFAIQLRYAHLISEEDRDWLRGFGMDLTEVQRIALVLARHDQEVTNSRLCQLTGSHASDVTKQIRELRDLELLDMESAGRWASYRLSKTALRASDVHYSTAARPVGDRNDGAGGQIHQLPLPGDGPGSQGGVNSSGEISHSVSGVSIPNNGVTFPDNSESYPNKDEIDPSVKLGFPDTGDPQENEAADQSRLTARLQAIALPAREKRRIDPAVLDSMLMELCAVTPLSLMELAELTNRTSAYLSERLSPLVASKQLILAIPESPTHPRQKYVTSAYAQKMEPS